jgi:DNA-binding response OmpR family regulator
VAVEVAFMKRFSSVFAASAPDGVGGGTRRQPGLLVVDDDPAVCALLASGLPPYGFNIWVAERDTAAVHLFRRHHGEIDLVLLDSGLLVYGGSDMLAALRRLDPQVRFCFTANFLDQQGVEQLFDQGAVGILTKPFRLDGLAAALRLLTAFHSGRASGGRTCLPCI